MPKPHRKKNSELTEYIFRLIVLTGFIPFEVIDSTDGGGYKVETGSFRTFRRSANLVWSLGTALALLRKGWVSCDLFVKSGWTGVPFYYYELTFVFCFCYGVFGVFAWWCFWKEPEVNCELVNLLVQKIHQVNQSEAASGHNVLAQLNTEGGNAKLEAQIAIFRLLPYQFGYMFLVPPILYFYDPFIPMLVIQDPVVQSLAMSPWVKFFICMALDTVFMMAGMSVLYYVMFITLGSIGSINFKLHDLNIMLQSSRKISPITKPSVTPSSVLSVMVRRTLNTVSKSMVPLAPNSKVSPFGTVMVVEPSSGIANSTASLAVTTEPPPPRPSTKGTKLAPNSKPLIHKIVSWRTRQLCRNLRELQLVIQYFNLGLSNVVFAMKTFSQVLTVATIFTAVVTFNTDLVIALLNICSGLEIGYLFLGTYDPAFSIPKKISELKANVTEASGNYAFKVMKKKYTKVIRSLPEHGIRVGCFRELERATSPNFIQFVTSTVASLLVAF